MLFDNETHLRLIDSIDSRLKELGIVDSEIVLDHIGYKVDSLESYEKVKIEALNIAEMAHENVVSGRKVGIFKFKNPVEYNNHKILGFEVVSPKEGEVCSNYWEHVEYVVNDLKELVAKYPTINWNQDALNRPIFAKVAIIFDDGLSAKFHTETVMDEISKM